MPLLIFTLGMKGLKCPSVLLPWFTGQGWEPVDRVNVPAVLAGLKKMFPIIKLVYPAVLDSWKLADIQHYCLTFQGSLSISLFERGMPWIRRFPPLSFKSIHGMSSRPPSSHSQAGHQRPRYQKHYLPNQWFSSDYPLCKTLAGKSWSCRGNESISCLNEYWIMISKHLFFS